MIEIQTHPLKSSSLLLPRTVPNLELICGFIVGIISCNNEEDSIKQALRKLFPKYYGDFSTHIRHTMVALVANKNEEDPIRSVGARLLTTYNPMGDIFCHGKRSCDPTCTETLCRQSPTTMMLLIKFIATGLVSPRYI